MFNLVHVELDLWFSYHHLTYVGDTAHYQERLSQRRYAKPNRPCRVLCLLYPYTTTRRSR